MNVSTVKTLLEEIKARAAAIEAEIADAPAGKVVNYRSDLVRLKSSVSGLAVLIVGYDW